MVERHSHKMRVPSSILGWPNVSFGAIAQLVEATDLEIERRISNGTLDAVKLGETFSMATPN